MVDEIGSDIASGFAGYLRSLWPGFDTLHEYESISGPTYQNLLTHMVDHS